MENFILVHGFALQIIDLLPIFYLVPFKTLHLWNPTKQDLLEILKLFNVYVSQCDILLVYLSSTMFDSTTNTFQAVFIDICLLIIEAFILWDFKIIV